MFERLGRTLRRLYHSFEHDYLTHTHPLEYLFLELTRRCNLRCGYCGSGCTPEAAGPELSTEEWLGVIRQVATDFDRRKVMVCFMGGEPLVVEGAPTIFRELGRLGFHFGMVSNGTRLDPAMARQVVASGMDSISLSLDAPFPLGDEFRGKGVTAKVEAAIGNLRAAGYRGILEVLTVVSKPVLAELESMRSFLRELQVPHWRLMPIMPIGRAASRPDLGLAGPDLRTLYDFIARARQDGQSPAPQASCECYLGDEYEGVVRPHLFRCNAGLTVASVLADGSIASCPELGRAFIQGNIRSDRLKSVWETRYQILRDRRWAWRDQCKGCEAWDACRGGSMHLYPDPEAQLLRCSYREMQAGE